MVRDLLIAPIRSHERPRFLAGGPERAVETAVAELLAIGALRIDSTGLLRATGVAARPDAVGDEILTRVTSSHTLTGIIGYLRTRPALWNTGHELAELGLLVPPRIAARFRFGSTLPVAGLELFRETHAGGTHGHYP